MQAPASLECSSMLVEQRERMCGADRLLALYDGDQVQIQHVVVKAGGAQTTGAPLSPLKHIQSYAATTAPTRNTLTPHPKPPAYLAPEYGPRLLQRRETIRPRRRHHHLSGRIFPRPKRGFEAPGPHHCKRQAAACEGKLRLLLPEQNPPEKVEGVDEVVGTDGGDQYKAGGAGALGGLYQVEGAVEVDTQGAQGLGVGWRGVGEGVGGGVVGGRRFGGCWLEDGEALC